MMGDNMLNISSVKTVNFEEASEKLENLKKALRDIISLSTFKKKVELEVDLDGMRFFEDSEELYAYLEDIC